MVVLAYFFHIAFGLSAKIGLSNLSRGGVQAKARFCGCGARMSGRYECGPKCARGADREGALRGLGYKLPTIES